MNNIKTIDSFFIHEDKDDTVGFGKEQNRAWITQQLKTGKSFCCIHLTEASKWRKGSKLSLSINDGLKWKDNLSLIQTKRKSFISYYHADDQIYK